MPLTDVRGLTLHEPFASFMLGPVGIRCKAIETRGYPCPPRATRLLITAAAQTTHRVLHGEVIGDYVTLRGAHGEGDEIVNQVTGQRHRITYGAALGIVTVEASLPMRVGFRDPASGPFEPFLGIHPDPWRGPALWHYPTDSADTSSNLSAELPYGLFQRGRFGWMTSNPRRLTTPVPCRGQQRVWPPAPALLERIAQVLP